MMMNDRTPLLIGALFLIAGCSSQTGPDSNVAVFETADKAMAARKQRLLVEWQEMTLKIANAERPDVKTIKGADAFSIRMSADGVEQSIDLSPVQEKLSSSAGKEREPIRAFLGEKFPVLDRARLRAMGFERARGMLHPHLANLKQTGELTPAIVNAVVIDLNWVPVVRWPGTDARTPVDAELAGAWGVAAERVSAAAMENLRAELAARREPAFDTIDLPGLGRYGTLRGTADPAVLLLPEFVAAVRAEWKTADELVVSFPARTTVNFLERKNERLLKAVAPEWGKLYAKLSDPMIPTMLVAGDGGLALFNYALPTSQPATKPKAATTRVYIVH